MNAFNALKLSRRHGSAPLVLDGFDLGVALGESVGLFGPNGCGKSTLLQLVAGVLKPTAGKVCFCRNWPGRKAPVAFLFQDYRASLLPWMRSRDNLMLPGRLQKLPRARVEASVEALVAHFDLDLPLDRYPYQLSGGQQQVLALLRALACEPRVLLLDEPFSALDHHATVRVRERLLAWVRQNEATLVSAVHDADDLIYLSDRVLILEGPPLRLMDDFRVPLPAERAPAIILDDAFLALKARALGVTPVGRPEHGVPA